MRQRVLREVVHWLSGLGGASRPEPDEELLRAYCSAHDGATFAELLRRHGPLVWGVCYRSLGRLADAEDAFQATFLVLARRAASVRKGDSLAAWLFRVAGRAAAVVRARRGHPKPARETRGGADPAAEAASAEARDAILDEVRRLPENYRLPLVLCSLEGLTKAEAARQLGWKEGTVSGRLARARSELRRRLARRGIVWAGGGLAGLGLAAPRVALATVLAALRFAAGDPLATHPSAAIAREVLRPMPTASLKALGFVLLVCSLGASAVAYQHGADTVPAPSAISGKPSDEAPGAAKPPRANEVVFSHERLCVTIWPAKTLVKADEYTEVKLRVVNSSGRAQSFRVMSCTWDEHWQCSNPRVTYDGWPCRKNVPMTIRLRPGEAYEKELAMYVRAKGTSKTESFRMGFTPIGENKTYWSNEVFLGLK